MRFIPSPHVWPMLGPCGILSLVSQCSATRATVAATPPVARYDFMIYQWNPKYGGKGTVTARFALIALVAWQYLSDSTLRKLFVHPKYG